MIKFSLSAIEKKNTNETKPNTSGGKLFTLSSIFNKPKPLKSTQLSEVKPTKKEETSVLKKEEIEAVKATYDLIIDLMKENNPDIEKSLIEQYDTHLKNIILDLSMKVKDGAPAHIINTHVNNAKFNLFEICMKKFFEHLSNVDGRLLNVLGRINEAHNAIVNNLISISSQKLNELIFVYLDNIQTAEGASHKNESKGFSPRHKEKEQHIISNTHSEKKVSVLPFSEKYFFVLKI